MAPLKPHWNQPSHPDIQEVIINDHEFTSKSLSKVYLPPFGLYAKMEFPPCTLAESPTYATVQCGRNKHLNLNSDLLYIVCEIGPWKRSLGIFDTANFNVIAGPRGLKPGEELTFFYPSTEWHMAQPFTCLCAAPTCRGRISGARDMTPAQLSGAWLNGHIRELLEERQHPRPHPLHPSRREDETAHNDNNDATAQALRDTLGHAEKVVEAARAALRSYVAGNSKTTTTMVRADGGGGGGGGGAGFGGVGLEGSAGLTRRGATSRELSGEMGGDTMVA
ncbi:hypothetical protein F5X99DRAFT_424691 [Biscogniauxia marginata]|nr:hypothetical protein F5X99DRAFT_424691 [Biscogniauxia marginata]